PPYKIPLFWHILRETRLTTGNMYTDKLFTGQRNMSGLGIYHYQSRFYSPKLGRFLSADSLVPNPSSPQDFRITSPPAGTTVVTKNPACAGSLELCPHGDSNSIPSAGTTVVNKNTPRGALCLFCAPTGIRIASPLRGRRS
ncbi:MAG: RHS repeat-associated core domain-containing protein, partial [Chloroflexota bacterium]